jgi:hypothetical protein
MTLEFSAIVERWPLERLIPHARNARTHSEEQVAQIAGSIAEFGFVNPVLVGDDGVIVAGHGRVMAARKLGLSEAPVIVLSHLTPTQRRALMIADNQIATNAGWNDEMLAAELAALKEDAFDLDLLGFDDAELDRLLATELEPDDGADEAPETPADPVSRPGDLWICGEHRVLCGDATVLADVEKVLDGELADMTFTEERPPCAGWFVRQSVFGRLAGYENVNDAERLRHDPAMRWIVSAGKRRSVAQLRRARWAASRRSGSQHLRISLRLLTCPASGSTSCTTAGHPVASCSTWTQA